MARSVYLADGTSEFIFSDPPDLSGMASELERLLESRLGKEIADLFVWLVNPENEDLDALEKELESYEASCERYEGCLRDVLDGLDDLRAQLASGKRLYRRSLKTTVEHLIDIVNEEL